MTQWSIDVDVFCEGCGKVIVNLKRLLTPTDFKNKYGGACPHCRRELNETFQLSSKKRIEGDLRKYVGVEPDPDLVKRYEKRKKELKQNSEE